MMVCARNTGLAQGAVLATRGLLALAGAAFVASVEERMIEGVVLKMLSVGSMCDKMWARV